MCGSSPASSPSTWLMTGKRFSGSTSSPTSWIAWMAWPQGNLSKQRVLAKCLTWYSIFLLLSLRPPPLPFPAPLLLALSLGSMCCPAVKRANVNSYPSNSNRKPRRQDGNIVCRLPGHGPVLHGVSAGAARSPVPWILRILLLHAARARSRLALLH
eukprot:833501-Rhodomonas_salina.1